jgi:hypothetical protein
LTTKTLLALLTTLSITACAGAPNISKTPSSDPAILEWDTGRIASRELSAELTRLPDEQRLRVQNNPRTLSQILENLMIYRELVSRGKQDPTFLTESVSLAAEIAKERQMGQFYLAFLRKQFAEKAEIPRGAIEEFYLQNQDKFIKPEKRRAAHILIRTTPENETAKRIVAYQIKESIDSGEDFAAVARQKSEDTETAKNGGDLGFIPKGGTVREFEAEVERLKLNEISTPIKTQFGFHIIKVTEIESSQKQSLLEASAEIRRQLVDKNVQSQMDLYLSKIKNNKTLKVQDDEFRKMVE